jgi:hypothetical protein
MFMQRRTAEICPANADIIIRTFHGIRSIADARRAANLIRSVPITTIIVP